MKPRISMITLGVDDLQKAVGFYKNGLKFPQLEHPSEDVAFFTLNGTWLGLYGRKALAEDAQITAEFEPGQFNSFALAHNLPSEQEVDNAFAEVLAAGATAIKQPQKVFWGGYSGYFKDPDGHLWEIAYNPFMWVGPDDD